MTLKPASTLKPNSRRICSTCIGEPSLRAHAERSGKDADCNYCDEHGATFSIEELANCIERAFEQHYEQTSDVPDEFEYAVRKHDWERSGQEVLHVIEDEAQIPEPAAGDVLSILRERHHNHESAEMGVECPFAKGSYYTRKRAACAVYSQRWLDFERSLKTEARFFNSSGKAILDDLFTGLSSLRTHAGDLVEVVAGPSTEIAALFRARVFAGEDEELRKTLEAPWINLGPPPFRIARSGRMNACGISVFYGATQAGTAQAEVRPPVGSKVAIAKFFITRKLRLLDVSALQIISTNGSIFDPAYLVHLQRAEFMAILSRLITRPVMPNEESLEYLATQAIADYLATVARLDGIVFPSVQIAHAGVNVVLFHQASRVEPHELPSGTKTNASISERDEEGDHPAYWVSDELPKKPYKSQPSKRDCHLSFGIPLDEEDIDTRTPSLRIDLSAIVVNHIKAVTFESEQYEVCRRSFEPRTIEALFPTAGIGLIPETNVLSAGIPQASIQNEGLLADEAGSPPPL